MKSVVICDTEPVAIEGLRALLEAGDLRVAAAETSLAVGMDTVMEVQPSVVVVDKAFGVGVVLDALRGLIRSRPETRAVVWGSTVTESETLRLMHAGVAGVIRKSARLETLLDCISSVAGGATWMDGIVPPDGAPRRKSPLTAREMQVLELVERGLTNKEIAAELEIRAGTVKIHLKHIFEKTGIHGRYGLALCGLKEKGLLLAPAVM